MPGACQRAERFLSEHIVGQDLAIQQLVTAVCAHLERLEQPHQTAPLEPLRPLVLSAHGPPGVGKTFTHQLLARVLYSQRPDVPAMDCPGAGCKGYKARHARLRARGGSADHGRTWRLGRADLSIQPSCSTAACYVLGSASGWMPGCLSGAGAQMPGVRH